MMILHLVNNLLTERGQAKVAGKIETLGRNILNYLLASGQTLPNNCYLCEEGRKRAMEWRVDVFVCLPDTLFNLQCHLWALWLDNGAVL